VSRIPESMREKLIGEVQDILLADELPFKHVVIMMDDGRVIESFSQMKVGLAVFWSCVFILQERLWRILVGRCDPMIKIIQIKGPKCQWYRNDSRCQDTATHEVIDGTKGQGVFCYTHAWKLSDELSENYRYRTRKERAPE